MSQGSALRCLSRCTNRVLALSRHGQGRVSHPTLGLTPARGLPGESRASRRPLPSRPRRGAGLGLPGGKGPRSPGPGSLGAASDSSPPRHSVGSQGWVVTKSLAAELLRLSLAIGVLEAREVTCASCYHASIRFLNHKRFKGVLIRNLSPVLFF